MTEESRKRDGFDQFRIAGELYGRLRKNLKFGDLKMSTTTWGESSTRSCILYRWEFNMTKNGERTRCFAELRVDEMELSCLKDVESLAHGMTKKLKKSHQSGC